MTIDQTPCDFMKPYVKALDKFRASFFGRALISAAPVVCTVMMILLLTIGIKMVNTVVTEQNRCVAAQVDAGVPKTNPAQMGCI